MYNLYYRNYLKIIGRRILVEKQERFNQLEAIVQEYKDEPFSINIARGIPSSEQLNLSNDLLKGLNKDDYFSDDPRDVRSYGGLLGIKEARELFSELLEVAPEETIVGGNSSLQLMYITLNMLMYTGENPWHKQGKIKFLCPSPGYDRHWNMLNRLNIQMIPIELTGKGPDMDEVEKLVQEDENIKGIFCVPKYSNPTGEVYSTETINRLAKMKTKADDFVVLWDNAYAVHHLTDKKIEIENILELSKKANHPNRPYIFVSTSKITFPGSGVAAIGTSTDNVNKLEKELGNQILSFDKINQKRHVLFLKNKSNILKHMDQHAGIIKPKFDLILNQLADYFGDTDMDVKWTRPRGGYFIHIEPKEGTASEIVSLMQDIGVKLTPANAPYPHGKNPKDNSIRIAPTFAEMDELEKAIPALTQGIEYVILKKELDE